MEKERMSILTFLIILLCGIIAELVSIAPFIGNAFAVGYIQGTRFLLSYAGYKAPGSVLLLTVTTAGEALPGFSAFFPGCIGFAIGAYVMYKKEVKISTTV